MCVTRATPCNAPALVDPNFTTTTPATLPAELSEIGFSQLFYGADAGDRENDTISVSSVNDLETPSTSPDTIKCLVLEVSPP